MNEQLLQTLPCPPINPKVRGKSKVNPLMRFPLYDQSSFFGRLKHFAAITNPVLVWSSNSQLYAVKEMLENAKKEDAQRPEIHRARALYQSAFHPDSGTLQNVIGRMSFQMYGGTALCAAMMIWYRATSAVVFWQWSNQSFNALVNYTNRNAKSELTTKQLGVAYVSATTAALGTSLGLKYYLEKQAASVLKQRLVPFWAVAAANCVNIPLMRQNELKHGLHLSDEEGNDMGHSKVAAIKGITQVVLSRIVISGPILLITPFIMEWVEKMAWYSRHRARLNIPVQASYDGANWLCIVPTEKDRLALDRPGRSVGIQPAYLSWNLSKHKFYHKLIYTDSKLTIPDHPKEDGTNFPDSPIYSSSTIYSFFSSSISRTVLETLEPSAIDADSSDVNTFYFNKGL